MVAALTATATVNEAALYTHKSSIVKLKSKLNYVNEKNMRLQDVEEDLVSMNHCVCGVDLTEVNT